MDPRKAFNFYQDRFCLPREVAIPLSEILKKYTMIIDFKKLKSKEFSFEKSAGQADLRILLEKEDIDKIAPYFKDVKKEDWDCLDSYGGWIYFRLKKIDCEKCGKNVMISLQWPGSAIYSVCFDCSYLHLWDFIENS